MKLSGRVIERAFAKHCEIYEGKRLWKISYHVDCWRTAQAAFDRGSFEAFETLYEQLSKQWQVNKAVKDAANKAGLDPGRLDVHALRKTFARLCQRACGDLWLTSKMMGHTEVTTTDRHYLFADTERERQAINAIPITPLPDDGPKNDPNGGAKTRKGTQDNVIRLAERKRVHCHNSATVRWSDGKRAPNTGATN